MGAKNIFFLSRRISEDSKACKLSYKNLIL